MHPLADGIRMWVFVCSWHGLYVEHSKQVLKGNASELAPTNMDDLHWFRILGKPGLLKTSSNMYDQFLKDPC